MSERHSDDSGLDPETLTLCRALEAELAAPIEQIEIPEAQDRALRAAAAERAAAIAAPARAHRRWLVGGAVACAAALVILVSARGLIGDREPVASAPVVGDINGDGSLDIIDALALSRGLRSEASPSMAWDVTGDGVVDDADLDWIAAAAVDVVPEPTR